MKDERRKVLILIKKTAKKELKANALNSQLSTRNYFFLPKSLSITIAIAPSPETLQAGP